MLEINPKETEKRRVYEVGQDRVQLVRVGNLDRIHVTGSCHIFQVLAILADAEEPKR